MKIPVINNREGLVQAQLQPISHNLSGAPIPHRAITLLPGLNLIQADELEQLRKNPSFLLNFTTKIQPSPAPEQNPECVGKPILEIFEVEGKDGKKAPLSLEDHLPLSKLDHKTVKAIVDETVVVGFLREWHQQERRPDVAHTIMTRINDLGGDPKAPGGPAAAMR